MLGQWFCLLYCSCSRFFLGFLALTGARALPTCSSSPWQTRGYLAPASPAFCLPPALKSLQSLTLAELLGLPLVLQLEDVTIPLSQKTFVPLPLGAESGGSFEMGLTWVPCAPCWAPPEAGMLQDRLKGASSLHGPVALGCTRFFKRLVSGA